MPVLAAPPEEVAALREEVAALRAQIAWLKRQLFGPGRGERLDAAQLRLQLGELEKLAAIERPAATITYERAASPAPQRTLPAESFAHLPVKETVEIIPAAVRAEPELYERIGEERTFEVDVTPPQLFKRVIVRPKFRHRLDRNRAPLLAPAPTRPVAGGYASAGLLAWIALGKYVDHLRSTGWSGCRLAGAPRSRGRRWPTGSRRRRHGWSRFTTRCGVAFWPAATCRPTRRRCAATTRMKNAAARAKAGSG